MNWEIAKEQMQEAIDNVSNLAMDVDIESMLQTKFDELCKQHELQQKKTDEQ